MSLTHHFKRRVIVPLGSLQLVIVLLLIVASAATIGTVLPQDRGVAGIEASTFPPLIKRVLIAVQAQDVYHAHWFQALLAVLFLNLACCTYLRFPATWHRLRLARPAMPGQLPVTEVLPAPPDEALFALLRARGYRVQHLGDGGFAEKGKLARWAPTIVHLALFVVLGGAITSSLASWRGMGPITTGDSVSSLTFFHGAAHGPLAGPPPPFDVKLEGFRMLMSGMGRPKQYYSDVLVTPHDGKAPYRATLWVNKPLIHEGVYLYQSTWGLASATVEVAGVQLDLPLAQTEVGYVSRPLPLISPSHVLFVKGLDSPAMLIAVRGLAVDGQVVPGTDVEVGGVKLKLLQYRLYSGFQAKADPGIPYVYLGSALLLLGLGLAPFSHREVWLRCDDRGWCLAGRASKGKVALASELAAVVAAWEPAVRPIERREAS